MRTLATPHPLKENDWVVATFVADAITKRQFERKTAQEVYERLFAVGVNIPVQNEKGEEEAPLLIGRDADGACDWCLQLPGVTLGLARALPDKFVPYFFTRHFNALVAIFDEFQIPLPQVPKRADWDERARYYLDLNAALQEFRRKHGLSPEGLCAFLYHFGHNYIAQEENELPSPGKAWWLIGGSGGPMDFDFLDDAGDDATSAWQANVDTRPGDICVMYCVSPRSYVHSVWRAVSRGFPDPFFYFYNTAKIAHPLKLPAISFKELRGDPVIGQSPYIRRSLTASSGAPITSAEYERLLAIWAKKGVDVGSLPRLPASYYASSDKLESERDVETKLLEPLLLRLGFKDADWTRCMSVRMGRGDCVYADYAIKPTMTRGEERVEIIVEAKLSLRSGKQLADAYYQAKSYALRLQAKCLLLVAREAVWAYTHDQHGRFDVDRHRSFAWKALDGSDALRELGVLLGR